MQLRARPRFRCRFHLGTFVTFVLVFACVCGRWSYLSRIQHDVSVAVERAGGVVDYGHSQIEHGERERQNISGALQRWAYQTLGRDYFERITSISVVSDREGKMNDSVVRKITHLYYLESLVLQDDIAISDYTLSEVMQLRNLRILDIAGCNITGRGLAHLGGLRRLESIDLLAVPITDDDLVYLSGLTNLKDLRLCGTKLTHSAFKHLGKLPRLKSLRIDGGSISGAGLRHLQGARELLYLSLNNTNIKDEDIARLAGLPITELFLDGTQITDAGLENMRALRDLKRLSAVNTAVTKNVRSFIGK